MPNIKSAMKRTRSIPKKTAVNKNAKSEIKTIMKKTRFAIEEGNEGLQELMRASQKRLQHMAAKGHMHKNTVARRMSRLQKALNKKTD